MIREIVKYPDPVLQRPAEPVQDFDKQLRTLVNDMFESMYAAKGIGLAAPQIGISKQITVIDLSFQKTPEDKIVLINPEITFREGRQYEEEGCLSLPDIREKVSRSSKVRVRAQNEHGAWIERDGEELLSRAFQHEIDHLHGILFFSRVSSLKRELLMRKIRRMQKNGEW
jgi:peptide deformylase